MPSVVFAISSICRMATPKMMPLMPATRVRRILSEMICERIILGVAPMARRMPISVVRSFTVTIMMLETPMAPARRVPIPTSQMRKLTPLNRLSRAEDIDQARAEASKKRAEEILARKNLNDREYEMAQARLKRALVRTSVR